MGLARFGDKAKYDGLWLVLNSRTGAENAAAAAAKAKGEL